MRIGHWRKDSLGISPSHVDQSLLSLRAFHNLTKELKILPIVLTASLLAQDFVPTPSLWLVRHSSRHVRRKDQSRGNHQGERCWYNALLVFSEIYLLICHGTSCLQQIMVPLLQSHQDPLERSGSQTICLGTGSSWYGYVTFTEKSQN